MRTAVGVMARAPSSAGKTRLAPHRSSSRLTALRAAMLADTMHALDELPDVTILFTPDEAGPEIAALSRATRGALRRTAGAPGHPSRAAPLAQ